MGAEYVQWSKKKLGLVTLISTLSASLTLACGGKDPTSPANVMASGGSGGAAMNPPGMPPKVASCDALPASGKWEQITPPGVATSSSLALDPFTVGTVWVGADPIGGGTPGAGGLFKSTDCGSTWTHVNTGTDGATVDGSHMWSIAIDPVDQGTIYVVGAYGPGGLWKSTNGGVDWVNLFPTGSEFAKTVQYAFASNVSMDPTNHLHLVVGTHADCAPPYDPVCQAETTDGGQTWHIVKIPNPTGGWVERTGSYIIDNTGWLYATENNGMFLTVDHGATFKDVTPMGVTGAAGGEFTNVPLTKSPKGNYYLPAFNMAGLLTSTDGHAWSVVPGTPGGLEVCVGFGGGNVFMADFQSGAYHYASEDDLSTWTDLPMPYTVGAKQGPINLSYDEKHHLLYSVDFTGGVWRIVAP